MRVYLDAPQTVTVKSSSHPPRSQTPSAWLVGERLAFTPARRSAAAALPPKASVNRRGCPRVERRAQKRAQPVGRGLRIGQRLRVVHRYHLYAQRFAQRVLNLHRHVVHRSFPALLRKH